MLTLFSAYFLYTKWLGTLWAGINYLLWLSRVSKSIRMLIFSFRMSICLGPQTQTDTDTDRVWRLGEIQVQVFDGKINFKGHTTFWNIKNAICLWTATAIDVFFGRWPTKCLSLWEPKRHSNILVQYLVYYISTIVWTIVWMYVQHLLLLQRIDMVSKGFSCLVDYAIRT